MSPSVFIAKRLRVIIICVQELCAIIMLVCDQLYTILLRHLSVRSSACDSKYEMDHVYEDLVSRATGGKLPHSFYVRVLVLWI